MADKPILFSAPMIKALLAGRKTQTRRLVKPQPPEGSRYAGIHFASDEPDSYFFNSPIGPFKIPVRIQSGDCLWVKEAWRTESHAYDDLAPSEMGGEEPILYDADADWGANKSTGRTRVSIHMPRWASRITLIVEAVKVERLHCISKGDAIAEGIEPFTDFMPHGHHWKRYRDGGWNSYVDDPIGSYASLWTEINGPGSWASNPWVTVYTFRVIKQNIDAIGGSHA